MTKRCCASCFGNLGIRAEIRVRSTITGTCDYCGTSKECLIDPSILAERFSVVLDAYKIDADGKPLVEWLRADWGLFTHPLMTDNARAKELLSDILNDGEYVRKSFVLATELDSDPVADWESFREELMHRNRYFPLSQINWDRVASLLSALTFPPDELPKNWRRARVQMDERKFAPKEMLAPPVRSSANGRANPPGIRYLYVASDPQTAVSEIRPHKGALVSVAQIKLSPEPALIDLRHPRRSISPLSLLNFLTDEVDACRLRLEIALLERLGEELSHPVLDHVAAFEYTPSQYLCEFIKRCGFDGVIYRSALHENGMNLALFKPEIASATLVKTYTVTDVAVHSQLVL